MQAVVATSASLSVYLNFAFCVQSSPIASYNRATQYMSSNRSGPRLGICPPCSSFGGGYHPTPATAAAGGCRSLGGLLELELPRLPLLAELWLLGQLVEALTMRGSVPQKG